jgi:leucyl-tRNA synthetase
MFVGPWEQGGDWNDNSIVGMSRWLNRIWNLVTAEYLVKTVTTEGEKQAEHVMHKTIKRVTEDMDRFRFNTMLAALMEYSNFLNKVLEQGNVSPATWQEAVRELLIMVAPSAPHIAEELWMAIGQPYSIHNQRWPKWDAKAAEDEEVTLVVQVNGKVRDKIIVPASISESEARELVLSQERVKGLMASKSILKIIYVPGKLINIVLK